MPLRELYLRFRGKLKQSRGARRIATNAGWLFSDRIYRTGLQFIISIFVARYLGADGYGLVNYALAFVALFRVAANLGLEEVLVREFVRYPEQRHEILGTAVVLRAAAGLVTIGLITGVVQFTRPEDAFARGLVLVASLANLGQAMMLIQRWNDANLLAKHTVLAANAALTAASAAKLALIYFNVSLVWFVWANVFTIWLNAVLLLVLYVRSGESVRGWRLRWSWARSMLKDAWPRIPTGAAGVIQAQLGMIVIGSMMSDKDVGIYSVAFRFYSMLLIFPNIICRSIMPMLTSAHKMDPAVFHRRLTRAYQLLLALFGAVFLAMIVLGFWGIELIYGTEYAAAGPLLILFALPLFLVFLGSLRLWYIVIENLFVYAMWLSFLQIAVVVVANLTLIGWLGRIGAVLAIVASTMTVFVADLFLRSARPNIWAILDACVFWRPLKPLPRKEAADEAE